MAFRHTEATKRKLSDMRRGEANPFFGRKHSPETLAKLAAATRTFNASRQYAINPRSLPDLAEWQRAYIAGLIDGEGTITMPVGRKGVQVSIANTYRPMIDWLVATCGGSVTKSNNPIAREHNRNALARYQRKAAAWFAEHGRRRRVFCSAGDTTVAPPATGLSPAYLPWSDRCVTMLNRQPRPDSSGRAPFAGKDDHR